LAAEAEGRCPAAFALEDAVLLDDRQQLVLT
jgi:hypothetical protein